MIARGFLRDNCALDKKNNLGELQDKWAQFLATLKKNGLQIDDTQVPITDTTIDPPDIRCDEVLDKKCRGVIEPNVAILASFSALFIFIIIGTLATRPF